MNLEKTLRERILSIMGILLVALAAGGIVAPEFSTYNVPTVGGVVSMPSPQLVSQIVAITDWPFYVPLIIGIILIGLDLYYYFTKNKVKIA